MLYLHITKNITSLLLLSTSIFFETEDRTNKKTKARKRKKKNVIKVNAKKRKCGNNKRQIPKHVAVLALK